MTTDTERLAETLNGTRGRTRYEGQEERTDEFLLRLIAERDAEIARLRAAVQSARAYRDAETDGTPRIWRGKYLQDLATALDEAIARSLIPHEPKGEQTPTTGDRTP